MFENENCVYPSVIKKEGVVSIIYNVTPNGSFNIFKGLKYLVQTLTRQKHVARLFLLNNQSGI